MARTVPQSAIRNPLDRVLGVDSNVRVLRVLVRHGGYLSSSDIGRRAGLSKSSTRLGLISLRETGVVSAEGSGYNRLYRLNAEHYFSKAIENLFAAEERRFAAIIDAVTDSPGDKKQFVKSLWVYGSVARGEDRLGSDLDVGVITEAANLAAVVDVVRDSLAVHSERLGFTPSVVGLDMEDVSRLARDDDPWWSSVVKDAIVLAGRRPEELPALAGAAADG
ncbi:nucleotidyltransferase domain-containing protein [Mesorhizobium sp.]|uniref:nucleotidyltransferase domain-containing protein n=1 Tax=Mesorhizobium sp. TaxID=1871066 RepID=UPI0025B9F58F|nr:nucleotidyltransferase domain-containing protein [Mesorhizobium sp.]